MDEQRHTGHPAFNVKDLFASSRLPIILQAEAAECGVACLAMVAHYFGHRASLSEIRRRFSVSLKGTTLKALVDMADGLGLASRAVRLELDELGDLKCPAILHWDLSHYVVLRRVRRNHLEIHDPARGVRRISIAEASRSFTGVALELTPTAGFELKAKAETVRFADVFGRTRGLVNPIVQIFLLSAVVQVFGLLAPMLNQMTVDEAINRGDASLLTVLAIGIGMVVVISASVNLLRGFVGLYMGTQLSFQLETNLLRHVLRLPVSWFEKRHIGDVMSRFNSLSPVEAVFTGSIGAALLDSFMLIAALVMMLIYSPFLSSIEAASIVVFLGVRLAAFPYFRSKSQEALHRAAQVQTIFLETLRGARTFKLFGTEGDRISLWQNEQARSINTTVELSRFRLFGEFGTSLINGVQTVVVWFLGAKMVIKGDMTLGMLLAFRAYTEQFSTAATGLVGQFFTYRNARIHLDRLADVIHAEPEHEGVMTARHQAPLRGGIGVRDLSFRYSEHEPWVLRQVSLNIEPGAFVCLTGPSGQGKTTLLKLLLGFYEPDEGGITYDGLDLRTLGTRHVRMNSAVVMQDDQLLSGTIAENIAFFDFDRDQAEIEAAAKAAQIHDEIGRLPMGYLTLLGDMGSSLSSGQRQRVLIARALYRKPKILFFDEGTSNLDPDNEHRVMEVIRSLPITRVVIAHHAEAILGADVVVAVGNTGVTVSDGRSRVSAESVA